jgi:Methyltransferase domain
MGMQMVSIKMSLRKILRWDQRAKAEKGMLRRLLYHHLLGALGIYLVSHVFLSFSLVPLSFKRKLASLYAAKAAANLDCGLTLAAVQAAKRAVSLWPDVPGGYYIISNAMFPGETYHRLLRRFHDWLRPKSYIEIGVNVGGSIILARPPTVAVGIDPTPRLLSAPNTICKLFPLTSDDYFAARDVCRDIEAETVDLAFIDGLHLFEQALRDFINIERVSSSATVVLIHDCFAIDALTAEREPKTEELWTGDVWKIIPCLREFRPDLNVFTIPTPPAGLGVVSRLDPRSTVLTDRFDEIVSRYLPLEVEPDEERRRKCALMVANDWQEIVIRLSDGSGGGIGC